MRQRIAATLALVCLTSFFILSVAHAQRATFATRQEVEALQKDLEDLRQRTVEIPTLSAAVQELTTRLASLAQELETLDRHDKAIPDALGRLDKVDEQVRALGRDFEALRTRLADLEQPWAPAPAGSVTHDGGFGWGTADGDYSVQIRGFLQLRYQLEVEDGEVEVSTLRIRRLRLGLSGFLGSRRTRYEIVTSPIDKRPALDYFIEHRFDDALSLRAGQYKTPFTRSFITSDTLIQFMEQPIAMDVLRYDRDLQVGVLGQLADGRFGYYAGIGNGAGANAVNDNIDFAVTLRADAVLLGKRFAYGFGDVARSEEPQLMIGAGFIHDLVPMPGAIDGLALENDVDGDGEIDNVRALSGSADVVLRYQGVELYAELVLRHEQYGTILQHPDNGALADIVGEHDSDTFVGWSGQATYVLPWSVLVGARVSQVSLPFLGVSGRPSELPAAEELLAVDAVANLLDAEGFRLLGLVYSYQDASGQGADPAEHRVILEGQLRL